MNESTQFLGKVICLTCGLPVPPEHAQPSGICLICQGTVKATNALLALDQPKLPARGFAEALAEIRKNGRPLVVDSVDAVMEGLGGAVQFGSRIAEDLKNLRGENIPEELRPMFVVDTKALKGFYELIARMQSDRDKLIGDNVDPLADVSEEDLMAIASQAATMRIQVDPEYRKTLLAELVVIDPQGVVDAAGEALDILAAGPRVEVIG